MAEMSKPRRYRAIFIGGPLDGQERVVDMARQRVEIVLPKAFALTDGSHRLLARPEPQPFVTYRLLFGLQQNMLIYSLLDVPQTLEHVLNEYMKAKDQIHFRFG